MVLPFKGLKLQHIRRLFVIFGACAGLFTSKAIATQIDHFGNYPSRVFTASDIGLPVNPRCECAAQGESGLIYVGTAHGIAVYDGVQWDVIQLPDNEWVVDIFSHKDHKLLITTKHGVWVYDERTQAFDYFQDLQYLGNASYAYNGRYNILKTNDGKTIFRNRKEIYEAETRNRSIVFHKLKPEDYIVATLNGLEVYIQLTSSLYTLNAKCQFRKNGDEEPVIFLSECDDSKFFYIKKDGEYGEIENAATNAKLKTFPQGKWDFLENHQVLNVIQISNERYFLRTIDSGVIEASTKTGAIRFINESNSLLPSDEVLAMFTDNQRGLWICTTKGVLRIQTDSPFRFFDDSYMGEQFVWDVFNSVDTTLFGTGSELLNVKWNEKSNSVEITSILESKYEFANIETMGEELHVAGPAGYFIVDPQDLNSINSPMEGWAHDIEWDEKRNMQIQTKFNQVYLTQKTGDSWSKRAISNYWKMRFYKSDLDTSGNLWMTSRTGAFFVFQNHQFDSMLQSNLESPNLIEGIASGLTNSLELSDRKTAYASAGNQFYKLDADTLQATPLKINTVAWDSTATIKTLTDIGQQQMIASIYNDRIHSVATVDFGESETIDLPAIQFLKGFHYTGSTFDTFGDIWFFGPDGAAKLYLNQLRNYQLPDPAPVYLRSIMIDEEPVLIDPLRNEISIADLRYDTNNISIRAGHPFFIHSFTNENDIRFKYVINGDDNNAIYRDAGELELTSLKPNYYDIEISAIDVFGRISPSTHLRFRLLPPWYQSNWAFVGYLVILIVIFIFIARWRLQVLEDKMWKERVAMQTRLELETTTKEAQINALRLQIHPHFLLNSLTFIAQSLKDNPTLKESVIQLSGFLKHTLDDKNAKLIPLKDEIDSIKNYLAIEDRKSSRSLDLNYEIDSETEDVLIPGLILQPLVENALKYGQSNDEGVQEIHMRSYLSSGHLSIVVSNSGQWKEPPKDRQPIGLENVRKRLELYFDQRAKLEPLDLPDQHRVEMHITIPSS